MSMDLKKTVGNHLVVGFYGEKIDENIKSLIHEYNVGSVILFARNLTNPSQISELTYNLQQEAFKAKYEYPLLICVDQENGIVRRLGEGTAVLPGAMSLGATGNPRYAYDIGQATAEELVSLGINWNLAPVVDVNNNSDNPVIGVRSFGENPQHVSSYGIESMKGMQSRGVISTLKHFPGHGDTNVDSHLDLPTVKHDIDRLNEIELIPFKQGISHGAEMIMTAHINFPNIEPKPDTPATLSKRILTDLLRNDMSYDGVITTDCMEMKAISDTIGTGKGAIEALKAGADLVMISHSYDVQKQALDNIVQAINIGELSRDLLKTSSMRLNKLKEKYLSWEKIVKFNPEQFEANVRRHQELADNYYEKSISVIKNNAMLPLNDKTPIILLEANNSLQTLVEEGSSYHSLEKIISKHTHSITRISLNSENSLNKIQHMLQTITKDSVIIYTTNDRELNKSHESLLKQLHEKNKVIVISFRNPYLYKKLSYLDSYINAYEDNMAVKNKVVQGLFGIVKLEGISPVTL